MKVNLVIVLISSATTWGGAGFGALHKELVWRNLNVKITIIYKLLSGAQKGKYVSRLYCLILKEQHEETSVGF